MNTIFVLNTRFSVLIDTIFVLNTSLGFFYATFVIWIFFFYWIDNSLLPRAWLGWYGEIYFRAWALTSGELQEVRKSPIQSDLNQTYLDIKWSRACVAQRWRNGLPRNDPGFDSRWERCIYWAARPSQGTVNGGAITKRPRCWRNVKHKQTNKKYQMEFRQMGIFIFNVKTRYTRYEVTG